MSDEEDMSVEETEETEEENASEDDTDSANDPEVDDPIAEGNTESARTATVIQILPVHAAPNTGKNALVVKRGRGRPRKVERMPTTSDLTYHAVIAEEKAKFVENDPVVIATTQTRADAGDMLRIIKAEVAREAAALHFQRIENEKFGKDTAQVSTRRIDALTKIANIELEIKKMGADLVDVRSEKIQKIFVFWLEKIKDVATETLSPEQADLFFNRLSTAMENWEETASEIVR